MPKILVVEDDNEINRLICEYLTTLEHSVISAENGLDAVRLIREQSDISLVLLDLMLPFQSGDMVLQKVREFSQIPVIIVSAKSTVQTKIDVIRMGADDYITKPFDLDELAVRIEAVLRRSRNNADISPAEKLLKFKKLTLDTESRSASVNGNELVLTVKEFAILELMLQNPSKLFSKANLFESVWNEPYFSDDNTIKVHMSNLRSKIKKYDDSEEYIDTVWGMGYKLNI